MSTRSPSLVKICGRKAFGPAISCSSDIQARPGRTFRRPVHLVHDTRPDDIGVSVSYPLPGTKFFDRVRAQLGEKTNWSDSEDLAMMFQGAYTDEFYRALHDALHAQVDSWNSGHNGSCGQERSEERGSAPDEVWWQRSSDWKRLAAILVPPFCPLSSDPLVQLQTASSSDVRRRLIGRSSGKRQPDLLHGYSSHSRLFPVRRPEGASDHEALSSFGDSLYLRPPATERDAGSSLRLDVFFAPATLRPASARVLRRCSAFMQI